MSVLAPNDTYPVSMPSGLPVAPGEGETVGPILALADDFPYTSIPFAAAGTVTVRYSRGEDSRPIPYPIEAE